jgi:hypothetical protein
MKLEFNVMQIRSAFDLSLFQQTKIFSLRSPWTAYCNPRFRCNCRLYYLKTLDGSAVHCRQGGDHKIRDSETVLLILISRHVLYIIKWKIFQWENQWQLNHVETEKKCFKYRRWSIPIASLCEAFINLLKLIPSTQIAHLVLSMSLAMWFASVFAIISMLW